jgi:hypothetical protein
MTALFYTVQRQFETNGRMVKAGDVVDAAGWRTLRQLIDQRYIRVATEDEISAATAPPELAAVPVTRGRKVGGV